MEEPSKKFFAQIEQTLERIQQRDFIGMTEVCRVVEHFSVVHSESKPTGVFNVGSGKSQTVLEMAQFIQQRSVPILGFEPRLQCVQKKLNEQHQSLNYMEDNLDKLGINLNGLANTSEIDSLLRFCQKAFT